MTEDRCRALGIMLNVRSWTTGYWTTRALQEIKSQIDNRIRRECPTLKGHSEAVIADGELFVDWVED
jgi:hypothetical protein